MEDAAGAGGLAELVGEDDLAVALEVAEDRLAGAEAGEVVLDDLVERGDGRLRGDRQVGDLEGGFGEDLLGGGKAVRIS